MQHFNIVKAKFLPKVMFHYWIGPTTKMKLKVKQQRYKAKISRAQSWKKKKKQKKMAATILLK